MIKNLKKSDVLTTPFVVTKPCILTALHNDDLLLVEEITASIYVAQEFIDYQGGENLPILNRECNIALEQQTRDEVLYEEGEYIQGTFDVNSDPKNNTGTYKRLIYHQIKNSFYNDYNNPTKMFGLENIDFQLDKVNKFLSTKFRVFTIPKDMFGEKMMEDSILLVDNSLDDNFTIEDDGYNNILAKENLFSRVQEVRQINNLVNLTGSNPTCDYYYTDIQNRQTLDLNDYNPSCPVTSSPVIYPDQLLLVYHTSGSITTSPTSSDGYYTYNTTVLVSASYDHYSQSFLGWTGSISSSNNPVSVIMISDYYITASFSSSL